MAEIKDNRKGKKYQHLTQAERGQIQALEGEGYGVREIAERIGRDKSTVSRELRRGTVIQRKRTKYLSKDPKYPEYEERKEYFAERGQAVYEERRKNSRKPLKIGEAIEFIKYADSLIRKEKWSPDAVCGRIKLEGKFSGKADVCVKTLYNYIDAGLMETRNIDLWQKVMRKPKEQRVRRNRKVLGASIEERSEEVNKREEFGHWEIDSVIGKRSDKRAVLTLVERKTRRQYAVTLENKGSEAVDETVKEVLSWFGDRVRQVFKSITGDNGSEFAGLSEALKHMTDVFFCHPYSSWEKGTNENHNGLLRRMVKKGKSIDEMDANIVTVAARWNNNLPRKILNYRTPAECFAVELANLSASA